MAEHLELVAEIPKVEKLTVQERLEYAKKRRKQQLKRWERDKDSDYGPPPRKKILRSKPLAFQPQFMLLDAATRGDVDEVKAMLENGVDPNICNDDGLTALHQACIDGCEEIMDILLENGAHLDSIDRELWTPLHAATACGNDDIVEYLLDQGANIVAINADGNMPIDLVDEDDNEELREILQAEMEEQGFTESKLNELKELEEQKMLSDVKRELTEDDALDLDRKNEQGATMVHIAAANGYEEALEFLLEQGAAVDIADKDGWQPIHGAAVWGNETTVEMLVENGADLDTKTPTGDTPLMMVMVTMDPLMHYVKIQNFNSFLVNLKKPSKSKQSKISQEKTNLSVKRTSLKDKITISQNEAKAEAILRVHPQLAFLLPKGTEVKEQRD
ncbi:hypothetical protein QZH41_017967 [Actinostola sp. cb2023]|nr:hypothetical protein QZH41_017967 [Actinostola sp. cb2023]